MIASTLADLGIKNCEVVSACPFQVSGTGALTGVMMAYEKATGTVINKDKKDIATQEVVITKDIAKDIGTAQAENIVNQAKTEVVQNNVTNKTDIQNTVTNIINNRVKRRTRGLARNCCECRGCLTYAEEQRRRECLPHKLSILNMLNERK